MNQIEEFYRPFAPYYRQLRSDSLVRASSYIEHVLSREISNSSGFSALDIGCGTGEIVGLLRSRGWQAFGVDLSPAMIDIAQTRFAPELFLVGDVRTVKHSSIYDLVSCFGDTINHFVDQNSWLALFKSVASLIGESGLFCFDVLTPHDHIDIWPNSVDVSEGIGYTLISRGEVRGDHEYVQIHTWFIQRKGAWDRVQQELHQTSYPLRLIAEWLMEAGFSVLEVLDGDTLAEVHASSTRWFFCARLNG